MFELGAVHVKFLVEEKGTGTGISPSTSLSPVSVITSMLLTFLHLNAMLMGRTSGRSLTIQTQQYVF